MDIEQFNIEKQDNFVCFIWGLRAKLSCGLLLKGPKHNLGFYNTYCISPNLDYASFQVYKILLKAAIASGTVDSYVEKFLLEHRIDVKLNDQAIAEISDALCLGAELYVNKKKVDMLQDPATYLEQRNKELLKSATGTTNFYNGVMKDVVKAIAGTENEKSNEYKAAAGQPWVKSLVQYLTTQAKSAQLGIIDIQYPILDSPYKAQKSKNSRELEAKKEFIKEGSK